MKQNDYKDIDYKSYRNVAEDATIEGTVSQETGMRITMNRVYNWMFGGLMVTALTAFGATLSMDLMRVVAGAYWLFAIAEIILVISLSATLRTISYSAAGVMFMVYSVLNGLTLSGVFLAFTGSSIFATFAACSLTFGGASMFAYMTHRDLSKIGSICIMALWGIIIATIINIFLRNTMVDLVISYIGVALFVGLTAYDTQKIRDMALAWGEEGESEGMKKLALIGALTLYLDFINLFLYLLRIFGKRR